MVFHRHFGLDLHPGASFSRHRIWSQRPDPWPRFLQPGALGGFRHIGARPKICPPLQQPRAGGRRFAATPFRRALKRHPQVRIPSLSEPTLKRQRPIQTPCGKRRFRLLNQPISGCQSAFRGRPTRNPRLQKGVQHQQVLPAFILRHHRRLAKRPLPRQKRDQKQQTHEPPLAPGGHPVGCSRFFTMVRIVAMATVSPVSSDTSTLNLTMPLSTSSSPRSSCWTFSSTVNLTPMVMPG